MRYELTDDEWTAIKPMPPNKPRGVRRGELGPRHTHGGLRRPVPLQGWDC